MNQWIVLVTFIPMCMAHFIFLAIKGNKWCDEVYNMEEEEEEED